MNAPDLTGFWFDDEGFAAIAAEHDDHDAVEQEALDELAERVSAARLVY
ncbi:MAG: hypothetical protein JSR18_13740 [Proteobacteria bacterium]|nr:hypothetical protein [Pseudomonadota bacterium]